MESEIAETAKISPKAHIGEEVRIGNFSVIHDNAVIGDSFTIKDCCTIVYPVTFELVDRQLEIGNGAHARSYSVLYEGSDFEHGIQAGHMLSGMQTSKIRSTLKK